MSGFVVKSFTGRCPEMQSAPNLLRRRELGAVLVGV